LFRDATNKQTATEKNSEMSIKWPPVTHSLAHVEAENFAERSSAIDDPLLFTML